jgi:hypothetical protein
MSRSRQVRIVSDGTPFKSHVFATDITGTEIARVRAVSWSLAVGDGVATAAIETVAPKVDVVADATNEAVCPYCGHRKEGWSEE